MKSIFTLFDTYSDAQAAVNSLLERDFSESDMAVVILEEVAKNNLNAGQHAIDAAKSGEIGAQTVRGLDYLVGGQSAVALPQVGRVYASGDLATLLVNTAASGEHSFQAALESFAVPETVAEAFASGVANGKLLFAIKAEDARAGSAQDVLIMHRGHHTGSYNDSPSPAMR